MKRFLIEYVNVIGYIITGIVFGLASFIFFLNLYHSKEVATVYVKSDNYIDVYTKNKDKLDQIKNNISLFNANQYGGVENKTNLMSIKSKLEMCISKYEETNANEIFIKKKISVSDVYQLVDYYQSDIVNDCITLQLYNLNSFDHIGISSLQLIYPFIDINAKMLMNDLEYVKRNLQNNSSFSFSSDYDKTNIFNLTRDSYTKIEMSYQNSIDLVFAVSEWFKNVVGGVS